MVFRYSKEKRKEEEGLLIHAVYNYHKNWGVDESYPCGDFYLTEVLKTHNPNKSK